MRQNNVKTMREINRKNRLNRLIMYEGDIRNIGGNNFIFSKKKFKFGGSTRRDMDD